MIEQQRSSNSTAGDCGGAARPCRSDVESAAAGTRRAVTVLNRMLSHVIFRQFRRNRRPLRVIPRAVDRTWQAALWRAKAPGGYSFASEYQALDRERPSPAG